MAWTYDEDPHFVGILDVEYKTPIEGKVFPLVSVYRSNNHYERTEEVERPSHQSQSSSRYRSEPKPRR